MSCLVLILLSTQISRVDILPLFLLLFIPSIFRGVLLVIVHFFNYLLGLCFYLHCFFIQMDFEGKNFCWLLLFIKNVVFLEAYF